MDECPLISSLALAKGFTVSRSGSGKKVKKFQETQASQILFDFLKTHVSLRAFFNSLVKSGASLDLDQLSDDIPDFFKRVNSSFTFEVLCKSKSCKKSIETINLVDYMFVLPQNKDHSCDCGKKNSLSAKDYQPMFNPKLDAIRKCLMFGETKGLFGMTYSATCVNCSETFPLNLSKTLESELSCQNCKQHLWLSTSNILDSEVLGLIRKPGSKDPDGTWLEWYVWNLLKGNGEVQAGLQFNDGKNNFEADVVVAINNQLIIIECKDTSTEKVFPKLSVVANVADYYVLVTTYDVPPSSWDSIEKIMSKNCLLVGPKDIEQINKKIQDTFYI